MSNLDLYALLSAMANIFAFLRKSWEDMLIKISLIHYQFADDVLSNQEGGHLQIWKTRNMITIR